MVRTSPSNAGGASSIPGWGAKIPRASWPKNQNMKQKQYCNKFNEDFKNGPHQKKSLKKKKSTVKKWVTEIEGTSSNARTRSTVKPQEGQEPGNGNHVKPWQGSSSATSISPFVLLFTSLSVCLSLCPLSLFLNNGAKMAAPLFPRFYVLPVQVLTDTV